MKSFVSLTFGLSKVKMLVFSSFWALALSASGQDVPKGVLLDDFRGLNCENQRSQLDILIAKTKQLPDSKGIIVIHGDYNDSTSAYKQRSRVSLHLRIRGVDTYNFDILLGKSEPQLRTELWTVPREEVGGFIGEHWNFRATGLKKPVIVHAESWSQGEGCYFSFDLKFYSEFLAANDNLIGRVIIRDKSIGNYNRIKSKIANEMAFKYKIPKNRLEFAFIQSDWTDVEYWYVPPDLFLRP